jgi:hypothetical protein
MIFDLENSLALLSRTPAALDSLLGGLPEAWTSATEGENTWSPIDIVAHLLYTEHVNWMPRVKHILAFGENQPFPPFKRFGHFDQQEEKSIAQLLHGFAETRAQSLSDLRGMNLGPSDFGRRGQHPAFASVTLAQLLAAWTTHDLTHLHQLTRVLAHQFRDAVGPFQKFLGVLQCCGHSAPV